MQYDFTSVQISAEEEVLSIPRKTVISSVRYLSEQMAVQLKLT